MNKITETTRLWYGKHKDKRLSDLIKDEPDYLLYVLKKNLCPENVSKFIRDNLDTIKKRDKYLKKKEKIKKAKKKAIEDAAETRTQIEYKPRKRRRKPTPSVDELYYSQKKQAAIDLIFKGTKSRGVTVLTKFDQRGQLYKKEIDSNGVYWVKLDHNKRTIPLKYEDFTILDYHK